MTEISQNGTTASTSTRSNSARNFLRRTPDEKRQRHVFHGRGTSHGRGLADGARFMRILKPYFSTSPRQDGSTTCWKPCDLKPMRLTCQFSAIAYTSQTARCSSTGRFISEREFCRNRLPVAYNKNAKPLSGNVAALPRRAALPGGHTDAARVHGLLLPADDERIKRCSC